MGSYGDVAPDVQWSSVYIHLAAPLILWFPMVQHTTLCGRFKEATVDPPDSCDSTRQWRQELLTHKTEPTSTGGLTSRMNSQ